MQCWKVLFSNLLDPQQFVLVNGSDPWVTFVIPAPDESPSALWLFDDVNKGRNLGKKGSQLDMTTVGLVWNTVGPRGAASARRYSKYVGPGGPTVQLQHDGSYALTFTGPYTITFWVKTDNVAVRMLLIEGYPNPSFEIWFWPSDQRDQILVAPASPNHEYTTVRNATGNDEWRHIAFVYRAVGDVSFYLNGHAWQHTSTTASSIVKQPTKICLFEHCLYRDQLHGSMACLSMFDRALTQEEMVFIMRSCP